MLSNAAGLPRLPADSPNLKARTLRTALITDSNKLTLIPTQNYYRAALLMCLKKYSAIGNSAIGNYVVLYCKLTLKTVLLEVSYGKND